jgi:diamine N-acetyltransferase
MPVIRFAEPTDSGNLAELAEQTFRDTFGEMNTVEDIDLHCRRSYGEATQMAEISNSGMVTLVCEEGAELIGFAQLRWGDTPSCVSAKSPGEIQRLYVARKWHGKGIAQDLMLACITQMEKRRSDAVWLGVWERNPRAISFYKKFGFVEVGEHIFPLGTDPQRDIVMVRPVGGATSR